MVATSGFGHRVFMYLCSTFLEK